MKGKDSFFYTTSYFRSMLMTISSISMIIFIIFNWLKNVDDYNYIEGKIISSQILWEVSPFGIKIQTHWYEIHQKKFFPKLMEKATEGRYAQIWYNEKDHQIEKLIVEGEVLYPYYKPVGVYVFFLIFCSAILGLNVIYLVRNPTHIRGY